MEERTVVASGLDAALQTVVEETTAAEAQKQRAEDGYVEGAAPDGPRAEEAYSGDHLRGQTQL